MAPVMPLQDSRARAERAFQLRAIGRSWRQIANELDYRSTGAVVNAVNRHMAREAAESADTSRRSLVESARLTQSVLFDRFAAAVARQDDQTVAVLNRELARNRDQLAKLLGAYAPERSEVDVTVGRSPAELLAESKAQTLAALAERRGNAGALPVATNVIDAEVIEA